jgi:calcineurin-like phosphoesterase family protein
VKTWITSDLHFGHANIKKFCPETRGRFRDVEHMRETMISEWNQLVGQDDTVYMLGDVAFLPAVEAVAIMRRLNGRKILIEGNHDRKLLNDPVFRSCFESVHSYLRLTHNGQLVVMCHYPFHFEWDQAHRGSVHFYGHVHGKKTGLEEYRARDVSFDATGRVVSDMDEMIADALKGKLPVHH